MNCYVGIICERDLDESTLVAVSDDRETVAEALRATGKPEKECSILSIGTVTLSRAAMSEIHDEYTRLLLKDSIEAELRNRGYEMESEEAKDLADDAADIAFDVYNNGESEEEAIRMALIDVGAA